MKIICVSLVEREAWLPGHWVHGGRARSEPFWAWSSAKWVNQMWTAIANQPESVNQYCLCESHSNRSSPAVLPKLAGTTHGVKILSKKKHSLRNIAVVNHSNQTFFYCFDCRCRWAVSPKPTHSSSPFTMHPRRTFSPSTCLPRTPLFALQTVGNRN